MANKLKNLHLTSVDLVRAGANQEADICLYKSAQPPEGSETPLEHEKNIFKRFIGWMRENLTDADKSALSAIEKDYSTFDSVNENRNNKEALWKYNSALEQSIDSIMSDNSLTSTEKRNLMDQSLTQFNTAMGKLFDSLCCVGNESMDALVEVSSLQKSERYDVIQEVKKYNPYHGPDGRFASAGAGGAVGGIAARTITGGGISIHVKSGKEPKSGYMCATYTDRSQWLKGDEVTNAEKRTTAIKSFMEKNKDVLSDPDNYLGTWYDTSTGNISLDISRNFTSKSAAVKFATEHNEKAIWDVKNMAEISTGGTGNNI